MYAWQFALRVVTQQLTFFMQIVSHASLFVKFVPEDDEIVSRSIGDKEIFEHF